MEARLRQAHANLPPAASDKSQVTLTPPIRPVGALFIDLGHALARQPAVAPAGHRIKPGEACTLAQRPSLGAQNTQTFTFSTVAAEQVQVTVVSEVLHVEFLTIQKHAATLLQEHGMTAP